MVGEAEALRKRHYEFVTEYDKSEERYNTRLKEKELLMKEKDTLKVERDEVIEERDLLEEALVKTYLEVMAMEPESTPKKSPTAKGPTSKPTPNKKSTPNKKKE